MKESKKKGTIEESKAKGTEGSEVEAIDAKGLNQIVVAFPEKGANGKPRLSILLCNLVAQYLEDHEVLIETGPRGHWVRMGSGGANAKNGPHKYNQNTIALEKFPAYVDAYLKVQEEIKKLYNLKPKQKTE